MATFLLLLAVVSSQIPHESDLRKAVSAYWNLMVKGEKATALKFVLPSCQNDFVNRVEPKVRSWELVSLESVGKREAVVTIRMEALFKEAVLGAGFQSVEKHETWVRDKNRWKLKVVKPSIAALAPLAAPTTDSQVPKALLVTPATVQIQFFNKAQRGVLHIQNGTDLPAELVSAKFDETRFDLVELPSRIEAGKKADMVIRYKGEEIVKNLESQMTLLLKHDGQEKLYQVPIIYNYFSDGARALFGLTEEEADKVRRGDKLQPVVKQPDDASGQPSKLPAPPGQ